MMVVSSCKIRLLLFLCNFILLLNAQFNSPIQPSISGNTSPCPHRPLGCNLNCPHGFAWGLGNTCLCVCQMDPCLHKICSFSEICIGSHGSARCVPKFVSASQRQYFSTTLGECPKLVGGLCIERCKTDSDCSTQMKCCSNGCGRECVLPVHVAPIMNQLPIQPLNNNLAQKSNPNFETAPAIIGNNIHRFPEHTNFAPVKKIDKVGHCPMKAVLKDQKCEVECNRDSDCSGVAKCCDSGCGRTCAAPERATSCIHLLSAVERLPSKQLNDRYMPLCSLNDGLFEQIQCDLLHCWCVNSNDGIEIYGTKIPINQKSLIKCDSPRQCLQDICKTTKSCPFGLRTDANGCPISPCECKNICDSVSCDNKFDECQLVEPDCAKPPCSPVPRCLLNPCANGLPMTLPTGVTALCTQTSQCWNNFWCHQIGYNGLGFCCPAPESAARQGFCEARVPRHMKNCAAECRSDVDCSSTSKCCFDGCGLKCMNVQFTPNPFQNRPEMKNTIAKIDTLSFNRGIINALLAECPEATADEKQKECNTECKTDSDCQGLQRCCSIGCSHICIYPQKTTSCMHDAITHEVYVLKNAPKCTSAGNYDEKQCDDERCWCVDSISGVQIPNSWVPAGNEPLCKAIHDNTCPILSCATQCLYGNQIDTNGCPICDCKNPCSEVHCPQNSICIVAEVNCFQKNNCARQPRCVQNVCHGHPHTDKNGLVQQCTNLCPQGFWCNNVGFPGSGGICCPEIITNDGQQVVQALPLIHKGKCPKTSISVKTLTSPQTCRAQCHTDSECPVFSKCCFDGCGTKCVQVTEEISSSVNAPTQTVNRGFSPIAPIKPVNTIVKIGQCPALPRGPRLDCRSGQDDCKSDFNCDGIKKCCFDGCFKRCLYAEKTTACLHFKAAFEKLATDDEIKCNKNGEFEEIQCGLKYCWCVNRHGKEVVGTRITKNLKPDCKARRFCEEQDCTGRVSCPFGYAKDSNGCETCECENPCKRVQCPSNNQICVPHPVDCLEGVCPQVPKCVVNICANGFPLYHETTWEPIFCHDNSQCHGSNSHCKIFKNNGGYCCVGDPPTSHSGDCPKQKNALYPLPEETCEVNCKDDGDCHENEKCCLAGSCSLNCLIAENIQETVTPSFHQSNGGQKIGECPNVEDLGSKICGSARVNTCQDDETCLSVQKCCFDGCAKTCQNPEVTTDCFNAKIASESIKEAGDNNVFEPKCDSNGGFEKVQSHRGLSWCVDSHGKEIAGTRTTQKSPNCLHPRSCPVMSCEKQCLSGFEMNDQGCPTCQCKNLCLNVECPFNHICRIVSTQCFLTTCTYVPRCLLNACPRGEPLERSDNGLLLQCDNSIGHLCPQGWFCHKFGMGNTGYCCPGAVPPSQAQNLCPPVPLLVKPRHSSHAHLECKLNHDCIQNGPCCFNGAGTSCKNGARQASSQSVEVTVAPIQAITSVSTSVGKLGVCPNNPVSNAGCRSDCTRDSECQDFQKCCVYGCGRLCQYPSVATACIHKMASFNEELSKILANEENTQLKPPVQCTADGLFRRIQCDHISRQCWCADINSGIEIIGTRVMSLTGQEPNCLKPRFCATSCHDLECEHGYRLDKNGCPLNGFCQCKTPCDDIKCSKENDICIHKSVSCLGKPCPKIAICRPNPCKAEADPMKDINEIIATCSKDDDCGGGSCQNLIGETRKGVCCPKDSHIQAFTSQIRIGDCPKNPPPYLKITKECKTECSTDDECTNNQRCCDYDCNKVCVGPSNATNCLHMQAAIYTLKKQRASIYLHNPQCDPHSGMYMPAQCDENENCWCVDTVTGIEFHGTKASGNGINVCTSRRTCPIQCDDRRTICPFGFETNSQGCPRSSTCRCRNPCDQIQCSGNQVCLLRPTSDCIDQTCLPVPTCEDNPCINKQKPAVEPRTYTQFTCLENRTQICPTGFYCTSYDDNNVGVCCPGQEPILSQQTDVTVCPHGDAFSNQSDGSPSECLVNQNDCPSTHYCMSKPSHAKGICCVTKRYVCNLEKDSGPCNAQVPRYYYDSDKQKCLSFTYSGCSGNLNNFGTATECEHFCVGTGVDILNTVMSDDGSHVLMDIYHMGFSLTGPLLREKHSSAINSAFREYLTKNFELVENEIRDLYIKDDNTVRFSINAPDAKEKANNISDAVSNGRLKFHYNGDTYKAEPQTWFLHQIKEESMTSRFSGTFMFWALMIASIIFAIIILIALCCGCSFLQKRRIKDNSSSLRGPSPSPYGQISAYLTHGTAHSPARSSISQHSVPTLSQRRGTKKHVFSTDDISAMRQNAVGGGNLLSPAMSADGTHSMVGAHTQGGRRPSRATLYY